MNHTQKALIYCISTIFICCKDNKKSEEIYVNINTETLKNNYHLGETLELNVLPSKNITIDSVTYHLGNKKIGSSKSNSVLKHTINKKKFGPQNLSSISYSEGKKFESALQINILPSKENEEWSYSVINTYPHDKKAYTQGLEFNNNQLIESTGNGISHKTGNKGTSSIRKVNPKNGEVIKKTDLTNDIFGEGATVIGNKIYQLTYKQNKAFVYDLNTLKLIKELPYFKTMEGWGLTNDGTHLYMTDGTDKMYKINPDDFSLVDTIFISSAKSTVPTVNELEWVDGKIYANFYGSNIIGVINPNSGEVLAAIECSGLLKLLSNHPDQDVFNGIAYNKKSKTFFVTGKNWDKMFEIKIKKNDK